MAAPTSAQASSPQHSHPSPQRGEVGLGALWFGIYGGPLAWIGLELYSYIATAQLCSVGTTTKQGGSATAGNPMPYLLPASIVAALLALAAVYVALRNWRRTRHERPGSGHDLLEVGEGRTRFLAIIGLITSIGFSIAFVFILMQLSLADLC